MGAEASGVVDWTFDRLELGVLLAGMSSGAAMPLCAVAGSPCHLQSRVSLLL
jgi:hypothetical protein